MSSDEAALWAEIKRLSDELERLRMVEVPRVTGWKDWTPTLVGFSANPTNCVYRYCLIGKLCLFAIRQVTVGTSNASSLTITLPLTATNIINHAWLFPALIQDNGGATVWGRGRISTGESLIYFGLSPAADAGFTSSGNKRVASCDGFYEV